VVGKAGQGCHARPDPASENGSGSREAITSRARDENHVKDSSGRVTDVVVLHSMATTWVIGWCPADAVELAF
jgi:hypothetical protein